MEIEEVADTPTKTERGPQLRSRDPLLRMIQVLSEPVYLLTFVGSITVASVGLVLTQDYTISAEQLLRLTGYALLILGAVGGGIRLCEAVSKPHPKAQR